jgi:NADH-quinone oxidoreductase subunit H
LLFAIAFFTVLERKILASMQRRRGPNYVGLFGSLQAIADAVKLLSKETIIPSNVNKYLFIFVPLITFVLSFLMWAVIPFFENLALLELNLSLLFIFALSSLNAYSIIMAGWVSNSKYAFLVSLRAAAQVISYEISLGLILLPIVIFSNSLNLTQIVLSQEDIFNIFPLFFSSILFFISILAETSRVPFDLSEAESELVSGYHVEYSSIGFTLFFLAEYSNILLMSCLFVNLYLGGWLPILDLFYLPNWFWFSIKLLVVLYIFVWIRATLPRYRYDQLMRLGWLIIFPLSLLLGLVSVFLVKIFV